MKNSDKVHTDTSSLEYNVTTSTATLAWDPSTPASSQTLYSYSTPSTDKDLHKLHKFIESRGIKPLKDGEGALMVIDDSKGNRYSLVDLFTVDEDPLSMITYEVMAHNLKALQKILKNTETILNKIT